MAFRCPLCIHILSYTVLSSLSFLKWIYPSPSLSSHPKTFESLLPPIPSCTNKEHRSASPDLVTTTTAIMEEGWMSSEWARGGDPTRSLVGAKGGGGSGRTRTRRRIVHRACEAKGGRIIISLFTPIRIHFFPFLLQRGYAHTNTLLLASALQNTQIQGHTYYTTVQSKTWWNRRRRRKEERKKGRS